MTDWKYYEELEEQSYNQTRKVKTKKNMCAGRESNPGLVRGRDVYYHYTTGA